MKKLLFISLFLIISISVFNCKIEKNLLFLNENTVHPSTEIIRKIIMIESKNNPAAYNEKEDAVGLFQIRPIMITEVNRLLHTNRFSLEDRWCPKTSKEIFIAYQNIVNPNWDPELAARKWNGGINGDKKETTKEYWYKFKNL